MNGQVSCKRCGSQDASPCPRCGAVFCRACAERPYEFCCGGPADNEDTRPIPREHVEGIVRRDHELAAAWGLILVLREDVSDRRHVARELARLLHQV